MIMMKINLKKQKKINKKYFFKKYFYLKKINKKYFLRNIFIKKPIIKFLKYKILSRSLMKKGYLLKSFFIYFF